MLVPDEPLCKALLLWLGTSLQPREKLMLVAEAGLPEGGGHPFAHRTACFSSNHRAQTSRAAYQSLPRPHYRT